MEHNSENHRILRCLGRIRHTEDTWLFLCIAYLGTPIYKNNCGIFLPLLQIVGSVHHPIQSVSRLALKGKDFRWDVIGRTPCKAERSVNPMGRWMRSSEKEPPSLETSTEPALPVLPADSIMVAQKPPWSRLGSPSGGGSLNRCMQRGFSWLLYLLTNMSKCWKRRKNAVSITSQ